VDEAEAVNYILSNHPDWKKGYHLLTDRWVVMTVIVGDLSKDCGLTV